MKLTLQLKKWQHEFFAQQLQRCFLHTNLPIGRYGTVRPVCGSTNVRGSPATSHSSCRRSPPPRSSSFVVALVGPDFRPPPLPPVLLFLPSEAGGWRENQWETSVPAAAISGSAKGPLLARISSVRSTTCRSGEGAGRPSKHHRGASLQAYVCTELMTSSLVSLACYVALG